MLKYLLAGMLMFIAQPAAAAEHTIEMLNKMGDERMVYSKKLVYVDVGDTVRWIPTDKTHNVVFLKKGIPDGAEAYKSKVNKEAEFTFTKPGVYAYKCQPHFGMGMIGFVVVGKDTHNLEAVKSIRYPGRAKKVAKEVLAEIK